MRRFLVLPLLMAGTLFAQPGLLPQGFLQLDIKGDSTFFQYRDQIVVLGFSYAIKADANSSAIAGGRSANTQTGADSITIFKRFDLASPRLLEACFLGSHFPAATLTLTRSDPGTLPALAEVTFKDVIVTAINIQEPTGAGSVPTELVTLQFGSAEWCYNKINPDGSSGDRVCSKFNISTRGTY